MQGAASTWTGTIGGTLLCMAYGLHTGDIGQTAVLAAIGALVSFTVSLALGWLRQRWKR